jgi:LPPG:FO 2-phospho-L-lactate transferase
MILALAGGVGGARLANGLAQVLPAQDLMVAVNTGDDFVHLGLHVAPDLDTVMYTLAGRNNPELGWGLAGESWNCMRALKAMGGPAWFQLGDRDLATHLFRTALLAEGRSLSEVTQRLCEAAGIAHRVVPMSDQPVRTRVDTDEGVLAFQDYFVRRHCEPRVQALRFDGAPQARPSAALAAALHGNALSAMVFCPSNPYLSIRPLLSIPGVDSSLRERRAPAVAVSPIIGGAAVKGPLAKIMGEMGVAASSLEIARFYAGLADGLVIDHADAALKPEIEALGLRVHVTATLMRDAAGQKALAQETLGFAKSLAAGRAQ